MNGHTTRSCGALRALAALLAPLLLAAGCDDDESFAGATGGQAAAGAAGAAAHGGEAAGAGAGGGGGTAGAGGGGAAGGGGSTTVAPAVWGACPEGYSSECATLSVPLDHAHPGGEAIGLHIARHRAPSGQSRRQVWLLAGGPGQGGHIYQTMLDGLAARLPDTDLMVIDHRGTGHSHRLACPQQDTPSSHGGYLLDAKRVPKCLEHLEATGDRARLAHFTTRQAAHDVIDAIGASREPGQEVIVWGGSYGTHWAHRVAQVAPAGLLAGVVLDGFMTPGHFAFTGYDRGIDEAGRNFAAACALDDACAQRLGPDPYARAGAILDGLRTQPCGFFNRDAARTWASVFLEYTTYPLVAPFLHRLERCNEADQTAIDALTTRFQELLASDTPEPMLNSGILQYNIVLSELWKLPGEAEPTAKGLAQAADAQTFLVAESYTAALVPLRTTWPLPPPDADDLPLPVAAPPPMLWLAGDLDSRTPATQAKAVTSLYPSQSFFLLHGAAHVPSSRSPLQDDPKRHCGGQLVDSFVLAGAADGACQAQMRPLSFSAPTAEYAQAWWGTPDDWGDGQAAPSLKPPSSSPAAAPSLPPRLHGPAPAVLRWLARRGR